MYNFYRNNTILDSEGNEYYLYPGVQEMLYVLSQHCTLAIASRIEEIACAYQCLHFFNISSYIPLKEIYPTSKKVHLKRYVFVVEAVICLTCLSTNGIFSQRLV